MTPTETQHGLSSTRIHHACSSGYKSWFKTARAGLRWWSIHVPQFLSSLVWQRKIEQKKKRNAASSILTFRRSGRWRSSSGGGAVVHIENFLMNLWIVQQQEVAEYLFLVFVIHSQSHACRLESTTGGCMWWRRRVCDWNLIRPHTRPWRNLNCQIHRSKLRTMSTVTVCPVMPTWP